MLSNSSSASASTLWRVFCAIEVPLEVRQRVLEHAERVRNEAPAVQASWTKLENIHLTLKFFGNVALEKIPKISKAADKVGRQFSPIKIRVEGCGAFPKRGQTRVLWIGLNDSSGRLANLHKEFDDECVRVGFASEDRAFHPHLTLARLRNPQKAQVPREFHTKFEPIEFTATGLTVFRSELGREGSRYSVISSHPLTR